jgi:hypothetical protein
MLNKACIRPKSHNSAQRITICHGTPTLPPSHEVFRASNVRPLVLHRTLQPAQRELNIAVLYYNRHGHFMHVPPEKKKARSAVRAEYAMRGLESAFTSLQAQRSDGLTISKPRTTVRVVTERYR